MHGVRVSLRFTNRRDKVGKFIKRSETFSSLESNSISSGRTDDNSILSGRTDDTIVDIEHNNIDNRGYNCEYLTILSPRGGENMKSLSNLSVLSKEGVVDT